MFPALLNPLSVLVSLSTLAGVVIHDTNIDKAAMAAVALPTVVAVYEATNKFMVGSDAHVHPEHHVVNKNGPQDGGKRPTIRPRAHDDRKHVQQKNLESGRHLFDNKLYPVV